VTEPATHSAEERDADVIVVGAGPAGSTAAYHLAQSGVDVLLLEKSGFPREKVCGDGLTPRAVKQLIAMGVDTEAAGWRRNEGLRIIGGGRTLELPWPELTSFPGYGLTCARSTFDETLARHAAKAGARLHEHANVTGPVRDDRTGRITGVTVKHTDGDEPVERTYRAPLVLAADGNSTRLSLAMGLRRREDRPMGVAVRTYYTSPRHDEDWLESWLELWDGPEGAPDRKLLPGYGWIFPMGDGTCNVGLGILDTSKAFQNVDYRDLLKRWLDQTPEEWGFRDETRVGPVRGAALPMGFNRTPHYTNGLMLLGDAGGMVNPFNGEGIAYAMESGALASDVVVQALAARTGPERERALHAYPSALKQTYGGYYTLGRIFVKAIGNPEVMRLATKHGLGRKSLMKLTLKMLANLTEPRGGDVHDRLVNGLSRIAPSA
jgi:geranylgeranyl reductase family protein